MAGDRHRDDIRGAGLRYGARRPWPADAPGDLGVACRRAGGNRADGVPHALLEGGTANVERQVAAVRRRLDQADYLRHQLLEFCIAADQTRLREAILQSTDERLRIVAELDGADTLLGCRHQ